MEDSSMGMEKISENKDIRATHRGYLLRQLELTGEQLFELAYLSGYEDATKAAARAVDEILKPGTESQSP
jgi:hypothetical protein